MVVDNGPDVVLIHGSSYNIRYLKLSIELELANKRRVINPILGKFVTENAIRNSLAEVSQHQEVPNSYLENYRVEIFLKPKTFCLNA